MKKSSKKLQKQPGGRPKVADPRIKHLPIRINRKEMESVRTDAYCLGKTIGQHIRESLGLPPTGYGTSE